MAVSPSPLAHPVNGLANMAAKADEKLIGSRLDDAADKQTATRAGRTRYIDDSVIPQQEAPTLLSSAARHNAATD